MYKIQNSRQVNSMDYGGKEFNYSYFIAQNLNSNETIELGGYIPFVYDDLYVILDEYITND